jgi:hypothetical protein
MTLLGSKFTSPIYDARLRKVGVLPSNEMILKIVTLYVAILYRIFYTHRIYLERNKIYPVF